MAFQKVGDYFVLVHTAMAPTDEEWDEWMQHYTYASILVVTDGGAPTASQRKRMKMRVDELRALPGVPNRKEPKVATVTASSFVRGVLTALRWFYHDAYAAFPPDHINQALTYLDVPPRYHIAMKTAVQTLRMQLKKAKGSGQTRTMPDEG
ncbi:hypothetical protein [Polyangium spumosum]|uniref:Uncharacterized protein n=1 Tax=Polyangium spumosum TaxID=889282 RepID=A0A6N7PVM1_9BACT|nr:hypothetical protein [Polyangium spumosum]MRG96033.1 hypothetical protein [Polyangium spumosum]